MPSLPPDDFFVGYATTPARTSRLLKRLMGACLSLAIGAAGLIASRMRDPGSGEWRPEHVLLAGTLVTSPYPILHADDEGGSYVLVGEGKVSAEVPKQTASPSRARVSGTVLRRGALRLLEVDSPIETGEVCPPVRSRTLDTEPLWFAGEIIDPKCFAGAMKPGTGKTHKACAALCLRGGIPPALVTDSGEVVVLTGAPLERFTELVGEPVEVCGQRVLTGELQLLNVTELRRRASVERE